VDDHVAVKSNDATRARPFNAGAAVGRRSFTPLGQRCNFGFGSDEVLGDVEHLELKLPSRIELRFALEALKPDRLPSTASGASARSSLAGCHTLVRPECDRSVTARQERDRPGN